MAEVSRTARVIQNAKVALFFYCINLILQFFSRKIFLDYLGAELLGLNTTAQNLLQFLNLAESGIGAAVAFALYKPLSQGNRQEIIDIVSLQGWFYRYIGIFVLLGSGVLMCFFPLMFAKANISIGYVYGTYLAFLVSALLSYFINYNIVLLSADQKDFKITIPYQGVRLLKVFVQIFVVWKFTHGYIWWLVIEVLAAVITSVILVNVVKSEYPWLRPNISEGKKLKERYSFLITKIKQMFFHRVGGYVLTQTTPLVIYAFTTLTTVAIYGNYWVIMIGCLVFMEAITRGLSASVGNLIAEGNSKLIKDVFWQIYTVKIFLAGGICFGIFYLSESFITLWVGRDFVMPRESMFVMVVIYFLQMQRTCDTFLAAYGLFNDIWAPIVEAVLNISLSFLLGYFWGLTGIFVGVVTSQLIVTNSWKAIFLYKSGFRESVCEFVILYTKKIVLLSFVLILVFAFLNKTLHLSNPNIFDWLHGATVLISVYLTVGCLIFYFADNSFKCLTKRFVRILRVKMNNFIT